MSQEEILLWQLSPDLNPLFPRAFLMALTSESQPVVTNLSSSRHFIFKPWVDNPDQRVVPVDDCWVCQYAILVFFFSIFTYICTFPLTENSSRAEAITSAYFFISHKISSKENMKNSARHSVFRQLCLIWLVLWAIVHGVQRAGHDCAITHTLSFAYF